MAAQRHCAKRKSIAAVLSIRLLPKCLCCRIVLAAQTFEVLTLILVSCFFVIGIIGYMLLSRSLAQALSAEFRKEGKTVVFTNGCFDILHLGHTTYLEAAKKLGDVLIIGVNSDDSVRRLKGNSGGVNRPVNPQNDRAAVLSALRAVDYTCIFDEDTPFDLISSLLPNILVKGGDYTPETIVGADVVRSQGGQVIVIPFVEGKSTTRIIERIHS